MPGPKRPKATARRQPLIDGDERSWREEAAELTLRWHAEAGHYTDERCRTILTRFVEGELSQEEACREFLRPYLC